LRAVSMSPISASTAPMPFAAYTLPSDCAPAKTFHAAAAHARGCMHVSP
jgi:hypothetical protein